MPLYLMPDGRIVASSGGMTGVGARRLAYPIYVDSGDGIDSRLVALQLHFDDADGAISIIDSSRHGRLFTRVGSPVIDTSRSVFGGSSGYFPADNGYTTESAPSLDMRTGAFQFDWHHRLESNLTSYSQPDTVISMVDGGTYAYEWAVIVDRDALRFYYGIRGTNNAHLRFILPPGVDFGVLADEAVPCSIARDQSGNWGAWVYGQRCPTYQVSPLAIGLTYGPVITGTYNNPVDFGASGAVAGRLSLGRFGPFASLAVTKHLDEFRYVVGGSRDVFLDYVPMINPFADPE